MNSYPSSSSSEDLRDYQWLPAQMWETLPPRGAMNLVRTQAQDRQPCSRSRCRTRRTAPCWSGWSIWSPRVCSCADSVVLLPPRPFAAYIHTREIMQPYSNSDLQVRLRLYFLPELRSQYDFAQFVPQSEERRYELRHLCQMKQVLVY